jgi:HD-like signal output (HDOD) protein
MNSASQPPAAQSLLGWFRRLFGAEAATPAPTAKRRPAAQPKAGAAAAPLQSEEQQAAWQAYCPAFAPYAQALALELVEPAPLTGIERTRVQQLTAAILQLSKTEEEVPGGLPTAALRVLNLVARPDLELSELASTIQQDPALTAAILRVANAASMGAVAGPINTVRDAVTRLGITDSARVAGVVAAQTLFSPQSRLAQSLFAAPLAELHVTSATIASGAAQAAMDRGIGRSDMAYLGGMLHDVGKTLAIATLADLMQSGTAPRELEPAVLDTVLEAVHVELGGRALRLWKLPQYLVDLCASHHDSTLPHDRVHAEQHLVRVAAGLIALRARPQSAERIDELADSLVALDITPLQARALDAGLRSRSVQVRQVLT